MNSPCQFALHSKISLADHAELQHLFFSHGAPASIQTQHGQVSLGKQSLYHFIQIALGHLQYRAEQHIELGASGATATVYYLALGQGGQKHANHLSMEHLAPETQSTTCARSVAQDKSHLSFVGKIIVKRSAQATNAKLEHKNILLSNQAQVHTQPLLEIDTDEVQCTHGATVGCLDRDALFYLQSRGIALKDASKILIQAFIQPILAEFNNPGLCTYLDPILAGL